MNSTEEAIHFEITADNENLKKKIEESRQAILDSGKKAAEEITNILSIVNQAASNSDASKEQEKLNTLLKKYQTYADKRTEIERKCEEELAILQSKNTDGQYDAQIKQAQKTKTTELVQVNFDEAKKGSDFTQLFGKVENLSAKAIAALRNKIQDQMAGFKDSLPEADFKTVSEAFDKLKIAGTGKNPFGAATAAIEVWQKANEEAKQAQEELNEANASGADKTEKVAAAELKLAAAQAARATAVADATVSINAVGKKGQETVGAAKDVVGILGDFGVELPGEITGAIEGVGQMMDGLASINLANPMSIVTSSIKIVGGLAKSFVSLFSGDAAAERRIKSLQKQIDTLQKSYNELGDAVDKAYSTDASKMIGQQNEMLEQQKVLIQNQIAAEQSKKNADEGKIAAWQAQLDQIDQTLVENEEKALDAIFGKDLKAAIDNFATDYAEAWTKGEDRSKAAKDTVRKMMQEMVTESIKAAMQSSGAMENIRKKLEEFYKDEILSEMEQQAMYDMAKDLQKELDSEFGWADSLMEDPKPQEERQVSSRGIASMSQESADELNGMFTAMQGMVSDLRANQFEMLDIQRLNLPNLQQLSHLSHLSTISENTGYCRRLEGIENDMNAVKGELQTMNLKGLIIRR